MKNFKIFSVLVLSFFMFSQPALGATSSLASRVYLEGPVSRIAPQSEFLVEVYMDTVELVNAFDLEINFNKDVLKFLNYDNTGSITDVWQASPYVAENGNIKLSGGIIRSFGGTRGLLARLAFRALTSGEGDLSFAKSNLYIADGKGTEVKAPVQTFRVSVVDTAGANTGASLLSIPPPPPDDTPPDISLEVVENPADHSRLIIFNATDAESGVRQTDIRVKKWITFSNWERVSNPVLYPPGAWAVELRAVNNAGGNSIQALTFPHKLLVKIAIPLFLAIFLSVYAFVHGIMNKSGRKFSRRS